MSNDEYKQQSSDFDENGNKTSKDSSISGRLHTKWLNMMYPRLMIARDLLSEEGVIFISIDDNEMVNLKKISDEIFGEENFISSIVWQKKNEGSASDSKFLKNLTENVLFYSKNINKVHLNEIKQELSNEIYKFEDDFVDRRGRYQLKQMDMASLSWSKKLDYEIELDGIFYYPGGSKKNWEERKKGDHAEKDWRWRWSKEKFEWGIKNSFIVVKNGKIFTKQYQYVDNEDNEIERKSKFTNLILNIHGSLGTNEQKELFGKKVFDHPKPSKMIKHLLNIVSKKSEIILDFFSGSATTAQAVLDLNKEDGGNRKFIQVQIPEKIDFTGFETIADIGRERIKRVIEMNEYKDGFRYLKLDSSNLKEVDKFNLFQESNIKDDRNKWDLVYMVLLAKRYSLTSRIEIKKIDNIEYFLVFENSDIPQILMCFEDNIPSEVFEEFSKIQTLFAIFKDSSFASDSDYINAKEFYFKNSHSKKIEVI